MPLLSYAADLLHALRQVMVDRAAVAVYACRSLERPLCCRDVPFAAGPTDDAAPLAEDHQRVLDIVAEADDDDYWFAASRDGNREAHYRGACLAGPGLWSGDSQPHHLLSKLSSYQYENEDAGSCLVAMLGRSVSFSCDSASAARPAPAAATV